MRSIRFVVPAGIAVAIIGLAASATATSAASAASADAASAAPSSPARSAPAAADSNSIDKLPERLVDADARVSRAVRAAAQRVEDEVAAHGVGAHLESLGARMLWRANAAGAIQVYVMLDRFDAATMTALANAGVVIEVADAQFHGGIQTWLRADQLDPVASIAGVRAIRLPGYAVNRRSGTVLSEGVVAHHSGDVMQEPWCLDGGGAKVGIISDGVDNAWFAAFHGNLPSVMKGVADIEINPALPGEGDEGTAMLEIVHDMAPRARLAFSGPGTGMEMVDSIEWLDTQAECKVICDDLGFLDQPFFADGPIAQAAELAVDHGRLYVSSAGNDAEGHYQGAFSQTIGNAGFTGGVNWSLHRFNAGGDYSINVLVPDGAVVTVFLQWDEQFGAAKNDYDLFIVKNDESAALDLSQNAQDGTQDPLEAAAWENDTGADATVKIVVRQLIAPNSPKKLELFVLGPVAMLEHKVAADSVYGHPAAQKVLAVAAVDAANTPCDGLEAYSSRGPSTIAFPAAESRKKPDVAATDKVHVSGAGCFACDPDVCDPMDPGTIPLGGCIFPGTSAAAPHIAGIAAQLLEAKPNATPAQITAALIAGAVDCGNDGHDFKWGYGFVNTLNAFINLNPLYYSCPADMNGSGGVDGADLGLLLAAWGDPACRDLHNACRADLNCDGVVDAADLGILLSAWGPCEL